MPLERGLDATREVVEKQTIVGHTEREKERMEARERTQASVGEREILYEIFLLLHNAALALPRHTP